MPEVDLTPFGFTPTESLVYSQLLEDGPSSGYALAKRVSIARANAYQALSGLVSKQAAEVAGSEPRTYRAVQAKALLARIARDAATRLDALEQQFRGLPGSGAPATVPFSGDAEFNAVLLRTAVRPLTLVEFLAPSVVLTASLPVWRTRQANGRPSRIWCIGEIPPDFPAEQVSPIEEADARERLSDRSIVLLTMEVAMLGRVGTSGAEGYWTSDPILAQAARGVQKTIAIAAA